MSEISCPIKLNGKSLSDDILLVILLNQWSSWQHKCIVYWFLRIYLCYLCALSLMFGVKSVFNVVVGLFMAHFTPNTSSVYLIQHAYEQRCCFTVIFSSYLLFNNLWHSDERHNKEGKIWCGFRYVEPFYFSWASLLDLNALFSVWNVSRGKWSSEMSCCFMLILFFFCSPRSPGSNTVSPRGNVFIYCPHPRTRTGTSCTSCYY